MKNTRNILIVLLAISALVAGGLLVYSYYSEKPVEKKPTVSKPVDPETQVDELVVEAGRNWVDSEVVDDKFTRTFYLGNVEYLADDNSYQPIDTTVVESSNESHIYENTANIYKTYFKEDTSADDLITLQLGGKSVAFSFVEPNQSTPTIEANTVTYANILDGLDAKYTVSSTQFLEELVAKEEIQLEEISQKVKVDGVYYKEQSDGSITFHNNETKKLLWILPAPVMYEQDDISQRNNGLHYEVTSEGEYIIVSKVIDGEGKEWLKNANYPIVIDYSLFFSSDPLMDGEILYLGGGSYDARNGTELGIGLASAGYNTNGDNHYRSYLSFDTSSIGSATVESATLTAYMSRQHDLDQNIRAYSGADLWSGPSLSIGAWNAWSEPQANREADVVTGGLPTSFNDCFNNPSDCLYTMSINVDSVANSGNTQITFTDHDILMSLVRLLHTFTGGARDGVGNPRDDLKPELEVTFTVAPPTLNIIDPPTVQQQLELTLTDNSDNENYWALKRSTDGNSWSTICNLPTGDAGGPGSCIGFDLDDDYNCSGTDGPGVGGICSFIDKNLSPNTQYFYKAFAVQNSPYARSPDSEIVSAYTLAAQITGAPTVESPGWDTFKVTGFPSGIPVSTKFCIGAYFEDWPGGVTPVPDTRYLIDFSGEYFLATDPNISDCHTENEWTALKIPPVEVKASDGGISIWPNRLFEFGLYAINNEDIITDPSVRAPVYSRAKRPQTPDTSIIDQTRLNLTMQRRSDPSNPVNTTEYAQYDDISGQYVDVTTGNLVSLASWGTYANWGGGTGVTVYVGINTCHQFKTKSRNNDTPPLEGRSECNGGQCGSYLPLLSCTTEEDCAFSDLSTEECTPAATPGQPTVNCNYEPAIGDYYFCDVTIDPNNNPDGTEYYTEYSNDNINWGHCSNDNSIPCNNSTPCGGFPNYCIRNVAQNWTDYPQGFPPSYTFSHNNLDCDATHTTYYYRVKARNSQLDETGWSSTIFSKRTVGYDTLPPCQPRGLGHTDNPIEAGPLYPIDWDWTAPASGSGISKYEVYDSLGNLLNTVSGSPPDDDYTQYLDALGGNLSANTQYGVYVLAYDSLKTPRFGRASSTENAYTAMQAPTGITFGNFETDSITVKAEGDMANIGSDEAGVQFQETEGNTGGGGETGFLGATIEWLTDGFQEVIDIGLDVNTVYGYQVRSRNSEGENADPGDIQPLPPTWVPGSPVGKFTRANVPRAPRISRINANTINVMVREDDGNPHGGTASDTQYAICVSQIDVYDDELAESYVDAAGQVNFTGDPNYCNNAPPGTVPWLPRGDWGANSGINVNLIDTSKYEFRVKARNGHSPDIVTNGCTADFDCEETAFGPAAVLFLVKNNIVGWAWSSNTGWLSMNCLNLWSNPIPYGYTCDLADNWGWNTYFEPGREINPVEGYAWSDNIGWVSPFIKVCSNNLQQGCFEDADCVGGNCSEPVAGTPPSGGSYGYCYTGPGVSGMPYGYCSETTTDTCVSDSDCLAGEHCVYYTCQTDNTCLNDTPADPPTTTEQCRVVTTANFNGATREIEGWARVLSRKDYGIPQGFTDWGWLKLKGQYDDGQGTSGSYGLTGVEVDSQEFLGDPDVNPNDVQLYSMFGWAWNSEVSDFAASSSWLKPINVTQNREVKIYNNAFEIRQVIDSIGDPHLAWSQYDETNNSYDIYYLKLKAGQWVTVKDEVYEPGVTDPVSAGLNVSNRASSNIYGSRFPSLALDSNDNPHIAWQLNGFDVEYGSIYYSKWDSASGQWVTSQVDTSSFNGQNPSLALDSSNNPHIAYRQALDGNCCGSNVAIYYKKWNGSSWVSVTDDGSNYNVSNTEPSDIRWPSLKLDANNQPHIAWRQGVGTEKHIYYRWWDQDANGGVGAWVTASGDDTAGAGADVSVNDDMLAVLGFDPDAEVPELALFSDGTPGIAWRDPTKVLFRKWSNGDWVSVSGQSDAINLQINNNLNNAAQGNRLSLAIDKDDQPHITWGDMGGPMSTTEIFYRWWNDSNWVTADGSIAENWDTPNFSLSQASDKWSRSPSLTLDKWGNAHVIWTEPEVSEQYCGAFDGDGVITGPAGIAYNVAVDDSYMYVVGDSSGNWRIEKRVLADGAPDTGFDSDGVIDGAASSNVAYGIAIDADFMYVVGNNDSLNWRIEKYNLTTGAPDTDFDDDGILDGDGASLRAYDIAIDSDYMYVVGEDDAHDLRIEKRRLSDSSLCTKASPCEGTGFGYDGSGAYIGDGVTTSDPDAKRALGIAIDNDYMYVVGLETDVSNDYLWRLEKRRLDTGALVPEFDSDGIITVPKTDLAGQEASIANDVAIDTNSMYVAGVYAYDRGDGNIVYNWRIQKRDLVNGSLTYDLRESGREAQGLAIDSDYMYVVGDNSQDNWRIQKHKLSDGMPDMDFDGDGVFQYSGSHDSRIDRGIAIDSLYMYLVGDNSDNTWRIEKRWLSTGALDDSNSRDDCTDPYYPQCNYTWIGGPTYRCMGNDIKYSKWFPGVVQSGIGWFEFMPAGVLLGVPWLQTQYSDIYAGGTIELAPPPRGSGQYTATYLILADGSIVGIPGFYSQTQTGRPTSGFVVDGFDPLVEQFGQPLGENALSKIDVATLTEMVSNCYQFYDGSGPLDCTDPLVVRGDNKYSQTVFKDNTTDISQSPAFDETQTSDQPVLNGRIYYFYFDGATDYKVDNAMKFMIGDADGSPSTAGNGLIIINGDLEINKDILYDQTALDPVNGKISELPSAAFIVEGNIYVNSLVSEISGVFVAKGAGTTDGYIYTSRQKGTELDIAASADDTYVSYSAPSGPYTNNDIATSLKFGYEVSGATRDRAFLRWLIDVPKGAEVRNAYIRLKDDGNSIIDDFNTKIYLIDSLDPDFTGSTQVEIEALYTLATSKSVAYDISGWEAGEWNETPDISALVQRFIDRSDYQENNYMGIVIKEGNAETVGEGVADIYKQFYAWDDPGSDNEPQLVIEYSIRRASYDVAIDAEVWDGGSNGAETCMRFGWDDGFPRAERTYLLFDPIYIPQNAEILQAELKSTICGSDTGRFQARQGLLVGYPGSFGADPWNNLPLDQTVSEVAQTIDTGEWAGGPVVFDDITRLIQSFVERTDYVPGTQALGLYLRRDTNELVAGEVEESRSIGEGETDLEVDYQTSLKVNGLFIARGYSFDRKYAKGLEPSESIVYDGRVVANTPPGLSDFTAALPIYQKVTP